MLRPTSRRGAADPHPHLVEVVQEVGRILVHPVRPGALELFLSITTREQSYAEGAGTASCEQVAYAGPYHDGLIDRVPQPFGGREEQTGVGRGLFQLVA